MRLPLNISRRFAAAVVAALAHVIAQHGSPTAWGEAVTLVLAAASGGVTSSASSASSSSSSSSAAAAASSTSAR